MPSHVREWCWPTCCPSLSHINTNKASCETLGISQGLALAAFVRSPVVLCEVFVNGGIDCCWAYRSPTWGEQTFGLNFFIGFFFFFRRGGDSFGVIMVQWQVEAVCVCDGKEEASEKKCRWKVKVVVPSWDPKVQMFFRLPGARVKQGTIIKKNISFSWSLAYDPGS